MTQERTWRQGRHGGGGNAIHLWIPEKNNIIRSCLNILQVPEELKVVLGRGDIEKQFLIYKKKNAIAGSGRWIFFYPDSNWNHSGCCPNHAISVSSTYRIPKV